MKKGYRKACVRVRYQYVSQHLFLFVCVCASQEMAVRALKQTGSRNIEAALEYISKMGYLDPRNELIVRVIKQTSPGTNTTSIS